MTGRRRPPAEECGVFGVVAPGPRRLAPHLLRTARPAAPGPGERGYRRHRRAADDRAARPRPGRRGLRRAVAAHLTGDMAIGHVRYSTTGANKWDNAQPVARTRAEGIRGAGPQRQPDQHRRAAARPGGRRARSWPPPTPSSSPRCSRPSEGTLLDAVCAVMPRLAGAYSVVAHLGDRAGGVPRRRTACGPWCSAASRTPAGAWPRRHARWIRSGRAPSARCARARRCGSPPTASRAARPCPSEGARLCVFESIYFARPDSVLDGQHGLGRAPGHGRRAGRGEPRRRGPGGGPARQRHAGGDRLRRRVGHPLCRGRGAQPLRGPELHPARPGPAPAGLRLKFNPLRSVIAGKRLVVVDDSIVRGNTTRQIVAMLEEAGATRGAPAHLEPAHRLAVLLRHRHGRPRRAHRGQTSRWPRSRAAVGADHPGIPLAGGPAARPGPAGPELLPGVLHRRLPHPVPAARTTGPANSASSPPRWAERWTEGIVLPRRRGRPRRRAAPHGEHRRRGRRRRSRIRRRVRAARACATR